MIKPAAKSWIIIICTLIIGIAIGFEISEIFIRHRLEETRAVRVPEGFVKIFGKMLDLEEKQKPVIDSILVKYHNRIDSISRSNMAVIAGIIDSMKSELKLKLTPEQVKHLDEGMKRMRRPGPPQFRDSMRIKSPQQPPLGSVSKGKKIGPPPVQRRYQPGEKSSSAPKP